VNPVLSKALVFVATSHWTHYVTYGGQQELRLAGTKREIATNAALDPDYLDLRHTDGQIASSEA